MLDIDKEEFREVIGSQPSRPSEIDTTSSSTVVYERKDIQKYEEKDDAQNIIFSGWKYLEREIPRDKWLIETTAANKQNLDSALEGLADTYLLILESMGEM